MVSLLFSIHQTHQCVWWRIASKGELPIHRSCMTPVLFIAMKNRLCRYVAVTPKPRHLIQRYCLIFFIAINNTGVIQLRWMGSSPLEAIRELKIKWYSFQEYQTFSRLPYLQRRSKLKLLFYSQWNFNFKATWKKCNNAKRC